MDPQGPGHVGEYVDSAPVELIVELLGDKVADEHLVTDHGGLVVLDPESGSNPPPGSQWPLRAQETASKFHDDPGLAPRARLTDGFDDSSLHSHGRVSSARLRTGE